MPLIERVGGKIQKQGWGTVYPFSFTTTTLQRAATKAYIVNSVMIIQTVLQGKDKHPI